jgi:nicotinamide riboside kinase
MKIALIGAQGVGKTTLSRRLHEAVPNSHIVKETVRECPYELDAKADFKTEWWVLSHSILAEQEAREAKYDLIITDRCLLDIAVYSKLINQMGDGRITDKQRSLIETSILHWFEEDPYDAIFFVKVSPEVWSTRDLDDGFRSLDLGWYKILTTEFEMAVERLQIHAKTKLHVIHNDGKLDQTYQQVLEMIASTSGSIVSKTGSKNLPQASL